MPTFTSVFAINDTATYDRSFSVCLNNFANNVSIQLLTFRKFS